ncbi:MAG: polyprenol monophosphomannose synthase [Planctomycetes bacterium]|nr:polyprenol monophosphomannose synthase [Planctomycetota bacterium]MCB9891267.1 polyprenol monophosphomannose synthase [Planctomycetota bacterium]MCB9919474.1 polyprenol monophosphomannose synthase [Planctomycetota bacterium]
MVDAVRRFCAVDVLVVDDNSPDGTGDLADRIAAENDDVFVLHREEKRGLGPAYVAGFQWGLERGYERLFEMDCDFSHAPWDLPRLAAASADADLVIGSRYVKGGATEGWTLSRRLLSRGANLYTRTFLGPKVRDWTAGFRCFNADMLRKLPLDQLSASGYSFQIEMAWRTLNAGGRIREVPIGFVDRNEGKSKMSRAIAMEAVRLVPRLRLRRRAAR